MTTTNKTAGDVHPLLAVHPTRVKTWEEWLSRWKKTNDFDEKMGLLHSLLTNERAWEKEKTVPFLLTLADGYLQGESDFVGKNETDCAPFEDTMKAISERRQLLARKAMSVLIAKFFKKIKQPHSREEELQWWWMLGHEKTFNKVLWFFREYFYSHYPKIMNFPTQHQLYRDDFEMGVLGEFLFEFAKLGWTFNYNHPLRHCNAEWFEPAEARLKVARPQLIKILAWLGKIDYLFDVKLDHASRKTLKEMALGEKISFPQEEWRQTNGDYRFPSDLAEALAMGSKPAIILMVYGARLKKLQTSKRLLQASKRKYTGRQKELELQRVRDAQAQLAQKEAELTGTVPKS